MFLKIGPFQAEEPDFEAVCVTKKKKKKKKIRIRTIRIRMQRMQLGIASVARISNLKTVRITAGQRITADL